MIHPTSPSQLSPERLSATQAARLLARREMTAEQLTRACLDRIHEREPTVQAWTVVQADAALDRARQLDRGPIQGLLHGLTLGVKDLFDTADLPTTYGSPIYAGYRPRADAASVSLCRQAGAVVLGKTVSTEFATFQPGPTRNPLNPAHTPGGSSSGSAAAVADYMSHLAFGTQTAGSIIRPAAFCGIVGYKPSFGHVTRAGVKSLSESLDTVGGFARTVDDVALLLAALTHDRRLLELDIDSAPRIGVFRGPLWASVDADAQTTIESVAELLSRSGAHVSDAAFPNFFPDVLRLQQEIMAFEAFQALSHERYSSPDKISAALDELLTQGKNITFETHQRNLTAATFARQNIHETFNGFDALLTPGALGEAPTFESGTGDPVLCRSWTLLGLPCMQLPAGVGAAGLPVGVQLVGRFAADLGLFQTARWVEKQLQRSQPI
jgi:Asp-tRNA(Asn)/Glu-tRNA(Gln) amidotransferase A subunit family amidase